MYISWEVKLLRVFSELLGFDFNSCFGLLYMFKMLLNIPLESLLNMQMWSKY